MHPCEIVYHAANSGIRYGETAGTCRITGKDGIGLPFSKWVKDTFTDLGYLHNGDIVCNEALFTFDEKSELIQGILQRDKPQKFRTYSHIVANGVWHLVTKADKEKIFRLITEESPEIVCLSDSGQKHLLFKNRPGFWQLEETVDIPANVDELKLIHSTAQELMQLGFSQTEIITGDYPGYKIVKVGLAAWQEPEAKLNPFRHTKIFDFATWMLFLPK